MFLLNSIVNVNALENLRSSKCKAHVMSSPNFCTNKDCIMNDKSFLCQICHMNHIPEHKVDQVIPTSEIFSEEIMNSIKYLYDDFHSKKLKDVRNIFESIKYELNKIIDSTLQKTIDFLNNIFKIDYDRLKDKHKALCEDLTTNLDDKEKYNESLISYAQFFKELKQSMANLSLQSVNLNSTINQMNDKANAFIKQAEFTLSSLRTCFQEDPLSSTRVLESDKPISTKSSKVNSLKVDEIPSTMSSVVHEESKSEIVISSKEAKPKAIIEQIQSGDRLENLKRDFFAIPRGDIRKLANEILDYMWNDCVDNLAASASMSSSSSLGSNLSKFAMVCSDIGNDLGYKQTSGRKNEFKRCISSELEKVYEIYLDPENVEYKQMKEKVLRTTEFIGYLFNSHFGVADLIHISTNYLLYQFMKEYSIYIRKSNKQIIGKVEHEDFLEDLIKLRSVVGAMDYNNQSKKIYEKNPQKIMEKFFEELKNPKQDIFLPNFKEEGIHPKSIQIVVNVILSSAKLSNELRQILKIYVAKGIYQKPSEKIQAEYIDPSIRKQNSENNRRTNENNSNKNLIMPQQNNIPKKLASSSNLQPAKKSIIISAPIEERMLALCNNYLQNPQNLSTQSTEILIDFSTNTFIEAYFKLVITSQKAFRNSIIGLGIAFMNEKIIPPAVYYQMLQEALIAGYSLPNTSETCMALARLYLDYLVINKEAKIKDFKFMIDKIKNGKVREIREYLFAFVENLKKISLEEPYNTQFKGIHKPEHFIELEDKLEVWKITMQMK